MLFRSDLHDGTLARYSAPAGWLEDMLSGQPPQGATKARPDGLGPTLKSIPARLDVIASRDPLRDGDELELAVQLTRHYSLAMLDPGAAGEARFELDRRSFAFWDVVAREWAVEPGEFEVRIGTSSRAIAHRAVITVTD